jgi:glutaredoxin 3
VFAKSYCPYCRATRSLLATLEKSMGDLNVHAIDLDKMDEEDGALIQMELLQQTGQRTVPNSECTFHFFISNVFDCCSHFSFYC